MSAEGALIPSGEIVAGSILLRHRLHARPETAGLETLTRGAILDSLAGCGFSIRDPYVGTDLVADFDTGLPGPRLLLRADMDALPVSEQTDLPFKSEVPGVMHACGHDVHCSILSGAARAIWDNRSRLRGAIRFVWQPGEECLALGGKLVAGGVIDDFSPDFAFALHCSPSIPLGNVASRAGEMMAGACHFAVEVQGRGGHGARPEKARSPIAAAAELAVAFDGELLDFCRRRNSTVSLGVFSSGSRDNVIPDVATLRGTYRTYVRRHGEEISREIAARCAEIAGRRGVGISYRETVNYPVLCNDPEAVSLARAAATAAGLAYVEQEAPSMSAEDFAFYLEKTGGAMVFLGVGGEFPLHSPMFAPPDDAVGFGMRYLGALVGTICRRG